MIAERLRQWQADPERMSRHMARWEWLRSLRARLNGYFWLPCPLCDRLFAGYEWQDRNWLSSSIRTGRSSGKGICPVCTLEGKGEDWYGMPPEGSVYTFVLDDGTGNVYRYG